MVRYGLIRNTFLWAGNIKGTTKQFEQMAEDIEERIFECLKSEYEKQGGLRWQ